MKGIELSQIKEPKKVTTKERQAQQVEEHIHKNMEFYRVFKVAGDYVKAWNALDKALMYAKDSQKMEIVKLMQELDPHITSEMITEEERLIANEKEEEFGKI